MAVTEQSPDKLQRGQLGLFGVIMPGLAQVAPAFNLFFTTGVMVALAGAEDILIPVSLSRRIHDAIPGSEWATTKGGHGCCWEYPAEFNQTFLDFVRRHGKG